MDEKTLGKIQNAENISSAVKPTDTTDNPTETPVVDPIKDLTKAVYELKIIIKESIKVTGENFEKIQKQVKAGRF